MRWLLILVLCGWAQIAQANKPVVAVFDIQNKAKLSPDEVQQLTEFIATQLTASKRYEVTPNSQLKEALNAQKEESYKACYDEECQIEIGKEVAADKALKTTVNKFGKTCVVQMQLYDLKKETSANAASAEGKCSVEAIFRLIKQSTQQLTGNNGTRSGFVQNRKRPSRTQSKTSLRNPRQKQKTLTLSPSYAPNKQPNDRSAKRAKKYRDRTRKKALNRTTEVSSPPHPMAYLLLAASAAAVIAGGYLFYEAEEHAANANNIHFVGGQKEIALAQERQIMAGVSFGGAGLAALLGVVMWNL